MANRTTSLTVRIEPEIKAQAEQILQQLGLSASTAINMFYKQIILRKGVPFDLTLPSSRIFDATDMSKEVFDAELEKGWKSVQEGRTIPAEEAFARIRKDLGL